MSNAGKTFEGKVRKSLKLLNGTYIRIQDGGARSKVSQPGDFIYASGPRTFLIECKTTGENAFPFSNVADHQIDDSVEWEEGSFSSRKGLFAIEFRKHGRMFLVSGRRLGDIVDNCGRKSLTVEMAEYSGCECRKVKGGAYDMGVLDKGVSF